MRLPFSPLPPLLAGSVTSLLLAAAAAGFVSFGNGFGSKWDDPVHGTPAVVTWSFVPDGTGVDPALTASDGITGTSQITVMRATYDGQFGAGAFDAAIARAFATWTASSGVSFVGPVADGGGAMGTSGSTVPDIRIGAFAAATGSSFSFAGAFGFGPPGDDLNFPDALAGDVFFNIGQPFIQPAGNEDDPIVGVGNDLENLTLHELGHAAIGLGHPTSGPGVVMFTGPGCCDRINRRLSPDDIAGARSVYGPSPTDADGDAVDDADDDCTLVANGPGGGPNDQLDTDADGFGNVCDCDFDQSGDCTIADFNLFLPDFIAGLDAGAGTDMDGDGVVGIADFNLFLPGFVSGAPGPAAP